jgi:DnaJ-class molecular chaperone
MASTRRDYYDILEVARTATTDDIHRAYRRLARRYHPDLNAGADARARFDEVSGAYEVLHDPERRARYDSSRRVRGGSSAVGPVRAPFFTSGPPPRDVPRFIDDRPPAGAPRRALVVRLPGWRFSIELW